ncbi:hypothetical protein EI94DRAFT_1707044 [Lactarius quietus]|nr:hypothetical protein EI94DRAFT_1707044 [Lactarius quietus]
MDLPSKIAEAICSQLTDYLYTYPIAAKTGILAGVPGVHAHIGTHTSLQLYGNHFSLRMAGCHHLYPVLATYSWYIKMLYATLYEWCNGKQQATGFSANKYLDVYRGHIDTLKIIKDKRPSAYHVMMVDIYTQASAAQEDSDTGVVVANIDLNSLED